MRRCSGCGIQQESSAFHKKRRGTRQAFSSKCKTCAAAKHQELRHAALTITKSCYVCKKIKTGAEFPKNKSKRYQLHSACRPCHRTLQKVNKLKTKERVWLQETDRVCITCKLVKPLDQFNRKLGRVNNKDRKCSTCAANYYRLHTFGLSASDYINLIAAHNNCCAICKQPESHKTTAGKIKPLAIDHCHITGMVRGLLCHACNLGIGQFKDSVELLESAIKYLTWRK